MKRGSTKVLILFSIFFLISVSIISLSSASFWDLFTGKATQPTNMSVPISSIAVNWVSTIPTQSVTEGASKAVTFYFTATVANGDVVNINDSSVRANFTKGGETTRENLSCVWIGDLDINPTDGTDDTANYSCLIPIWYWDGAGSWNVTAAASDVTANWALNSSTSFSLNDDTCFVTSPNQVNWASATPGATNKTASDDPSQLNNTCNHDVVLNAVSIKALDLSGVSNNASYIGSANFTVYNNTGGTCSGTACIECGGNLLSNNSYVNVTGSILTAGNNSLAYGNETSGQEKIYYCLKLISSTLPAQTYSTSKQGPWTIQIG
jgi:hypothetical protein